MQLDETKDRIFIADLDAELAKDDEQEDKLVFLPEIDKRLTKIPKSLLHSQNPPLLGASQELVLYNVPASLSVPQEQDSVRKAIIEARARVREKQAEEWAASATEEQPGNDEAQMNGVEDVDGIPSETDDVDAMDIG